MSTKHLRHVRDVMVCELGGKGQGQHGRQHPFGDREVHGGVTAPVAVGDLTPRANTAVDDAVGEREVA